MLSTRTLTRALGASTATVVAVVLSGSVALASPPDPPSSGVSSTHLAAITVAAEANDDTYDRDLFPHWISQGDGCDTREKVLERDGTDVVLDSACHPTSGTWFSVYDEKTLTSASGIDIDHIVPLAEAWRSGASSWTTDERRTLANDLTHAQLIAVSASSNRSKGDQDPSEWQPTNTGIWCEYAREWIDVKYVYDLTADAPEKATLADMLGSC